MWLLPRLVVTNLPNSPAEAMFHGRQGKGWEAHAISPLLYGQREESCRKPTMATRAPGMEARRHPSCAPWEIQWVPSEFGL
jgi:hypothetical protein